MKPYVVLLRREVENPFAHLAGLPDGHDEGKDKEAKDKEGKDKGKGKDKDKEAKGKKAKGDQEEAEEKEVEEWTPPEPVEIDLEGLASRVVEVPVDPGLYTGLTATAEKLFYLELPVKGMAETDEEDVDAAADNTLIAFDLEEKEAEPFMDGVSAYDLAPRAEKIAVQKKKGEIYVVDAGSPPEDEDLEKAKVELGGVVIELDPREEWEQIYYEAWRHQRDFYWDPGMGGNDWAALRDQYAALLPRLATRDDLRDLIGELIGELNTSHTYVWGGDRGVDVRSVSTGLLGADLVREGDAFRVARIYRGDPADHVLSPLAEPGVEVREGDHILAVNHRPFPPGLPFDASLAGLAGKDVLLTVNASPNPKGARDVVVEPLRSEGDLRYADWVRRNREMVAEKTGGRIGYIHLPDMGARGLIAFETWFYPQLDKEGMIVDCRWNGGGFVSQLILERFRRPLVSFDRSRGGGVYTYPYRTLNGPFVVLTNELAGSDGDIFPMAAQLEGLAPVIGQRSWGGVIGVRGDKALVDGGMVTEPEFAWWDPRQGWGLENRGVIPDIEVQNLPQDVARGADAQLERGVAEVLGLRAKHPPVEPRFGPVAPKTREAYRTEAN